MNISNQHSFHQQHLLQNAQALRPAHYASLTNAYCIPDAALLEAIPVPASAILGIAPAQKHPLKIIQPVTPQPAAQTPAAIPVKLARAKSRARMTWKPGRGAIEKVDRFTGEIMHLVEERIYAVAGLSFAHAV